MTDGVLYSVDNKLFSSEQLKKKGWNDNQISSLESYYKLDNKYFSRSQLSNKGWTDDQINGLVSKPKKVEKEEPV